MNEGQDLNYVETYHDLKQAIERASELQLGLQKILVRGTITVRIDDEDGNEVCI